MTVLINDNGFNITSTVYADVEHIWFRLPISFAEAVVFGDAPTISVTDGGIETSYDVVQMLYIKAVDGMTEVAWQFDTVERRLEKQLEEAEIELSESNNRLTAIRQAIESLSGIPTLAKLTAFLAAIKEILHYE